MAYSAQSKKNGETYYLHGKSVNLRGGRQQTIFYFARDVRDGALDTVPASYSVLENTRTGLPMLKKQERDLSEALAVLTDADPGPPRLGLLIVSLLANRTRKWMLPELESYYRDRKQKHGHRVAKRLFYWHVIRTVLFAPIGTLIKAVFPLKLSISTGRSKDSDEE